MANALVSSRAASLKDWLALQSIHVDDDTAHRLLKTHDRLSPKPQAGQGSAA